MTDDVTVAVVMIGRTGAKHSSPCYELAPGASFRETVDALEAAGFSRVDNVLKALDEQARRESGS